MKKIIVTEKISDKGVALLKAQKDLQVDVEMNLSREELLKRIPEYDAIVVRSVTKINEEFYEHATNLKVVGRAGNGVDNIQMEGATKRGIIVVNTPESNIVSAAEHTIGLMLSSCRNTVKAHKMIESRVWNRDGLKGMELMGKTLGIIGLGRIGGLVTTRMQAFGMKVIAYDPYPIKNSDIEYVSLDTLFKNSDIISLHCPLTEETKQIVSKESIAKMKKGVFIINTSRGGLIDSKALLEGIKERKVGAACLDVYDEEADIFYNDKSSHILDDDILRNLISMPNVIVTSHQAFLTHEALSNIADTTKENIEKFINDELNPTNEVCYHCGKQDQCSKNRNKKCF